MTFDTEPTVSPEYPRAWDFSETLPPGNRNAVSVSMPTWEFVYRFVTKLPLKEKLSYGYPRIFIHPNVRLLMKRAVERISAKNACSVTFPSRRAAERSFQFFKKLTSVENLSIIHYKLPSEIQDNLDPLAQPWAQFYAVVYPSDLEEIGRNYYRWAGDCISARRSELILAIFDHLVPKTYTNSLDTYKNANGVHDEHEDYALSCCGPRGRQTYTTPPLDLDLLPPISSSMKARFQLSTKIANLASSTLSGHIGTDDVFLYPTGMCALFASARAVRSICPPDRLPSALMFGFPYTDTPKMLSEIVYEDYKFFAKEDYDELESLIKEQNTWQLQCESPTNPLLDMPDMERLQELAHKYNFIIVCDETVGTLINVDVMRFADIVCTSLTKISSGAGDVMGGSAIVNPQSRYRQRLLAALRADYEDLYYPPDVRQMAHNIQDMAARVRKVNRTSAYFADWFAVQPLIKHVYFPTKRPSKQLFDRYMKPGGGYGYLMSLIFHEDEAAEAFYDGLQVAKGPSLGLNFTLVTAYTLLAHYDEFEWAAKYGVIKHLVRVSFGLEDCGRLETAFAQAMEAAQRAVDEKAWVGVADPPRITEDMAA